MRLLVLDIDGVFCTFRSHFGAGKYGGMMTAWDRESCGMVRFLCNKFNFKIVISSTWRLPKHRPILIQRLKENKLYEFLLPTKIRYTPCFKNMQSAPPQYWDSDFNLREIEIREWLRIWRNKLDIEEFFVIDDDSCRVFDFRWIQTNMQNGFSVEHFEKIYNYFEDKKYAN